MQTLPTRPASRRNSLGLLGIAAFMVFEWITFVRNLARDPGRPTAFYVVHGVLIATNLGIAGWLGRLGWRGWFGVRGAADPAGTAESDGTEAFAAGASEGAAAPVIPAGTAALASPPESLS